jgi:hypothetical protein
MVVTACPGAARVKTLLDLPPKLPFCMLLKLAIVLEEVVAPTAITGKQLAGELFAPVGPSLPAEATITQFLDIA